MTDEQIFEKVFKKKPEKRSADVLMPVFFEFSERPLGMVKTRIESKGGELQIESPGFMSHVNRLVAPDAYRPHEILGSEIPEVQADPPVDWIPLSFFANQAYRVEYDEKKLELRIRVPPQNRKMSQISMMGDLSEFEEKPTLEPSALTSYLNVLASQDLQFGGPDFLRGRQPLRTAFENGTNIGGFVLESTANYVESTGEYAAWRRGDVRLVHDSPGWRLRKSLGDLNFPVTGYQLPLSLGGVSVHSQFGLEPSRLTVPTGNFEIFLRRAAKVQVINNGRIVRELDLPAGRHNLKDLQFVSGYNDVRLLITDDLGHSESASLSYFFASDLLAKGVHQVSYSLGVPWQQFGTIRDYDISRPTASLFHRFGFSNHLTLGGNAQADKEKYLIGGEALLSTPLGYFKLEGARSVTATGGSGYAFRGKYFVIHDGRNIGAGLESKSPYFRPMALTEVANTLAHELTGTLSQSVSERAAVNLGISYQFNRTDLFGTQNSFRIALGLNRSWGTSLNGNVAFQQSLSQFGQPDSRVSFFLVWTPGGENQSIAASYDLNDDAIRTQWSYNSPSRGVGSTKARFGLKRSPILRGYDGQVQYSANRFVTTANVVGNWYEDETTPINLVNFQLGTALVYAGGRVALSRPVSDSFFLLSAEKNFKGQTVELNPKKDDTYLSATSWLGPAVIPDLSAYNFSTVLLGTAKLKPGTVVDKDRFTLLPKYKSGYAVILGTDASISLAFTLINPDGSPIGFQPGKIVAQDRTDFEPITFFTGKSGKSRVDGFMPGRYEIHLFDGGWETLEISIPETDALHDAGKLTMKVRPQAQ
ncbi:MAG: fimbria/pilus outer membrane usher protein [Oligoflexia bacterium]|nr:fimbria/pilus outer membrane usher protein [Oligoflexia bacterium]